jgi:uncharacterized protein YoxC
MTPNEVFFGLITAAIIALVVVLIWLCLRLGETVRAMRGFLDTAQQSLQESLGELNGNLRALRTLTDNINVAADNVTSFTGSVRDVGDGVKEIAGNVRQIGDIVRELGIEVLASVHGVRAGLKTGFGVLLKSLFSPGATR